MKFCKFPPFERIFLPKMLAPSCSSPPEFAFASVMAYLI